MNEYPILFSTPMVQANLSGHKTMTRRIVSSTKYGWDAQKMEFTGCSQFKAITREIEIKFREAIGFQAFFTDKDRAGHLGIRCPYGLTGDLLWVREAFYAYGKWRKNGISKSGKQKYKFIDFTDTDFQYKYTDNPPLRIQTLRSEQIIGWYKRSSMFMPKAASRIWLQVEEIRVERLQDITEEDAKQEGVISYFNVLFQEIRYKDYLMPSEWRTAISSFQSLWIKINGEDSWNSNPWVWVISFKVISTTGRPS